MALHRTLLEERYDPSLASRRRSSDQSLSMPAPIYCAMPLRLLGQGLFADLVISEQVPRLAFGLIPQRISDILDVYVALGALGEADPELLKWLQKTREIFERLSCRFCGFSLFVPVYLFVFCTFFFEFPSGIRHPCTTMPWTIWPALAVLWGVCWMFIADKGISLPPEQRLGQHVDTEGM
jgi:hypothetical protein